MGQAESVNVTNTEKPSDAPQPEVSASKSDAGTDPSSAPSLDSLIAEAAAFGDDAEDQSLEAKAQKALDCPCIANLRTGPCGSQFSAAFLCFLKSSAEEKGSDCVTPFVDLQNCIKANPNTFSKDVLEEEEEEEEEEEVKKEEKPAQEYRIHPPLWSVESKKKKTKKSTT